jgi:outer membrane receptor for ferrienterochelin and colicin
VRTTTFFKGLRLGSAPAVLGLALIANPAFAQQDTNSGQTASEAGQAPADEEVRAEAGEATPQQTNQSITVTGSRIQSPTITSVAPVQVVSDQEIDQSGVTNIQDLLLENPAFGTSDLSRTNSAFLTSGTGVASVDLRDLGSDRTLVLINGRRVVAGVPGSATSISTLFRPSSSSASSADRRCVITLRFRRDRGRRQLHLQG